MLLRCVLLAFIIILLILSTLSIYCPAPHPHGPPASPEEILNNLDITLGAVESSVRGLPPGQVPEDRCRWLDGLREARRELLEKHPHLK